jgi:outer membrane protein assembly factor BamB/Ca2+-binding EF-hand superfamily protein
MHLFNFFRFSSLLILMASTVVYSLAAAEPADSGNWTQWRGPNREGISNETGLLKVWPEMGPKVIWKIDSVGVGYSSLVIQDGRIYTQGDLNGVEHIICLDAKDGQTIWAVQPAPVAQALTLRVANELKQLDTNQNGQVDEDEALARLGFDFNRSDEPAGDNPQQIAEQRVARLLKAFDNDNDQELTAVEARLFGKEFTQIDSADNDADVQGLAKQRAQSAFSKLDANSDGKISREEARDSVLNHSFGRIDEQDQVDPKNPNRKIGDELLTQAELEKYFEKQETGKDGVLTVAELQQFFSSRYANRDGILTAQELRGHFGGYRNGMGDGPRGTPTIDGDRIYAEGGNGDVTCLNAQTGETIWHVNLVSDFGGGRPGWGYSESPLIENEMVIVTPGGPKGTLLALNKMTGEAIWQSQETTQGAHYSSPIAAEIGGIREIVQFARESCFGVEAATGKLMWQYSSANNGTANCSTPIVALDHVFASSAYGTGGGLAKITTEGEQQTAKQVYFEKSMGDHHGGTVKIGDYLYSMGGGRLICLNFLTGEIAWQDRSVGKGSLVAADGMLYLLSEGQQVGLAEATPEGYREHGNFKIEGHGRPSWAHPVVAGGRLYIRDQGTLTAFDLSTN